MQVAWKYLNKQSATINALRDYKNMQRVIEITPEEIKAIREDMASPRGSNGLLDIICCYKSRFIGLEVKKLGGKLTKLQEVTLRDIERAGGITVVAHSLCEVQERLKTLA